MSSSGDLRNWERWYEKSVVSSSDLVNWEIYSWRFQSWLYGYRQVLLLIMYMYQTDVGRSLFSCVELMRAQVPLNLWYAYGDLSYEEEVSLSRVACDILEGARNIRKAMHHQALEIVKLACSEIKCLDNAKASSILIGPFLSGVQNGIHEIVKEILESFPQAITFADDESHSIFHLAVMYRHEKIYKIVHQQSGHFKMSLSLLLDNARNNILHLVAYKPHQDRLDISTRSFLKMQRELQWYKEVERFVLPQERKSKNADGKTPLTIFNEEHHELAANETQWMIGMATSCTVAASLIATVAFAAAITVPGGNNSKGFPMFSEENAYVVFAISDALALLASITTVLSFLSIFTSRYAVHDFLYALPNRLIIGLISLFLSVTSLMTAFSSTMFLVHAQKNVLILVLIIAFASAPVTLFACLQLPPLLSMIKSTYGPSIFD
ncbi:hypothetical protein PHJA_000039900 [Phtheirospermum japonicum]|uniref:PGG domain-containing protein n=1 Tax=Phtheirospermum japonicum TaxID=374723 RepID=A0A830B3D0_9LAMI|nr:hypothetical protein PHJA_000039900 [Phtheirospermum japonicum]